MEVRQLKADEADTYKGALAEVLLDCIDGGASVSFMRSLTSAEAESFFDGIFKDVAQGKRILLAAFVEDELVGTVQAVLSMPPNQPHRADIAKLLVRRSARGKGVGKHLMQQVEEASRRAGKTLLVLDAVTGGDGERLYESMGWVKVGVIPDYALFPDGAFCSTTIFWKRVA